MAALFQSGKTKVDIVDIATGLVVQKHDVEGNIGCSVSVQKNMAAMAVSEPHHGVHVMSIESGKVLCKFIPPKGYGYDARDALSRDTFTLGVGNNAGTMMMMMLMMLM